MPILSDFHARLLDGTDQPLQAYEGKVALIVNTASQCGFTPQYAGLEELWQTYRDRGLVVLGFPCNQFGGQEPGGAEQIGAFCERNYGVTFPMFDKIDVNGPDADPLFVWLRQQARGTLGTKIRWNFTKFLVDASGVPRTRYGSTTDPRKLVPAIEKLLPPA